MTVGYADLLAVRYPLGSGGQGVVYKVYSPDGDVYALKVSDGMSRAAQDELSEQVRKVKAVHKDPLVKRLVFPYKFWTGGSGNPERLVQLMDYCGLGSLKNILAHLSVPYALGAYPPRAKAAAAAPQRSPPISRGAAAAPAAAPNTVLWDPALPKLSTPDVARVAKAVLEALVVLKEAKIVHNDIKPSNIMVTDKGHIKVADFGGAQKTDTYSMHKTHGLGSYDYMAPERLCGHSGAHTYEADVYSLGKTLLHLAMGQAVRGDLVWRVGAGSLSTTASAGAGSGATHASAGSGTAAAAQPQTHYRKLVLPQEMDEDLRDFVDTCLQEECEPAALPLLPSAAGAGAPATHALAQPLVVHARVAGAAAGTAGLHEVLRGLCASQDAAASAARAAVGLKRPFRALVVVESAEEAEAVAAALPVALQGGAGGAPPPRRLVDRPPVVLAAPELSDRQRADASRATLTLLPAATLAALRRRRFKFSGMTHIVLQVPPALAADVCGVAGGLFERGGKVGVCITVCSPEDVPTLVAAGPPAHDVSPADIAAGRLNAPQPRRPTAAHLLQHPFLARHRDVVDEAPDFAACLRGCVRKVRALDERYEVEDADTGFLGRGTYGEVWKQRRRPDTGSGGGAYYAVKHRFDLTPEPLKDVLGAGVVHVPLSFIEQERRLLAAIAADRARCGYILALAETVQTPTAEYLVMELADMDLRTYVLKHPRKKRLPMCGMKSATARAFAAQLFNAIDYIHGLQIVHRDVKPENILVVLPPAGAVDHDDGAPAVMPTLRLADFGSAKILRASPHKHGGDVSRSITYSLKGDPAIFAPEVLQGLRQGFKTHIKLPKTTGVDMWAAGCVLFYMLEGETPFDCHEATLRQGERIEDVLDLFRRKVQQLPDRAEWRRRPRECDLVQQLLQFDNEQRPDAHAALGHPWFDDLDLDATTRSGTAADPDHAPLPGACEPTEEPPAPPPASHVDPRKLLDMVHAFVTDDTVMDG